MDVIIYTDGACSVSKRLGGYAAIALFNGQQIVVHGNKKNATNNEMEILAVNVILQNILRFVHEGDSVAIHSDSAYVVNAINEKWLQKWQKNGWVTSDGKKVKNGVLWAEMLGYLTAFNELSIDVKFVKVKGHSNCKLNNYVDRLAVRETELLKK